jgi:hypothetical protein
MDWIEIQKSVEQVVEMNRHDNSAKVKVTLPNVTIYNIPTQDVVRVDIKTK